MVIDSSKHTCQGGHIPNEDSLLCCDETGVYAVADGLGGHADGEKASAAAVGYLETYCKGHYPDEFMDTLADNANNAVIMAQGSGCTTLAAVFVENDILKYTNVGDSRVYIFRKGKIIARTKDDSVCQVMVDMGELKPSEVRFNENRSALLKVLGRGDQTELKKNYPPVKLRANDAFLICSDGFWEYVTEQEMCDDLKRSLNSYDWIQYMLERVAAGSQNKGDNYTAVCGIVRDPSKRKALPVGAAAAGIALLILILIFCLR